MILNTIRLLETRLNDGTDGVNALLASVPDDDADGTPANVTVVTPYGTTVHAKQLARRHMAKGFAMSGSTVAPKLILFPPTPADYDGWVGQGQERAGVEIAMGYVTERSDSASAGIDAHMTMRAAKRSIDGLMTAADATRLKSQISILRTRSYQLNEVMANVGDVMVQLVGIWNLHIEDQWK